ncbi:hypothetical protein Tco_0010362 [Tanacetum coccineum]
MSCGHIAQQSKLAQGTLPSLLSMGRKPLYQPKSECQLFVPRGPKIATNDDERRIDLDILEERREQAAIREEKAKSQMKGYYDARVRRVSFRPGDFVYRANDQSPRRRHRKLWYQSMEGPYEVTEALGKGAYKLRDMEGRELPRTWNICNLKKCYL